MFTARRPHRSVARTKPELFETVRDDFVRALRTRLLLPQASGSAGGSAAQQRIAVHGDAVAPR